MMAFVSFQAQNITSGARCSTFVARNTCAVGSAGSLVSHRRLLLAEPSRELSNSFASGRRVSFEAFRYKNPQPTTPRLTSMAQALEDDVKAAIKSSPVIVFSKTHCPYCARVKALLKELKVDAKVVELDTLDDGSARQAALLSITGQRTVPNVFIGGNHIGGCDATMALHQQGQLLPKLKDAGVAI
mmetsp:Transcript_14217/g.24324  ORF Transcript_14217/g.24324 Transcript_14217/m.24324 type:complete len:186 (-) Transcript_14217:13-570(-)|eukprot:CAMPEP_0196655828 /NCGR_PEP_ID=MMETSP1086-20130531/9328_1 /TAXON_ID=77921 /ORGANISM="Cyanoptyche  gloeocystis , Strain SAG4.97" /LENGTH=185 /DNA_ID=CAMNT_0041988335 /DNA_START=48 /DNA_END=605 /DNA_ORIENTATION=+